jgi:sulfite reductase alpha subunit-like flavoprotein
MSKYPEHDKLHEVKDKSQAIGEFLEWLGNEKRGVVCQYEDDSDYPVPMPHNILQMLAEYFEIDLDKIEEEKQQMLEEMRKAQGL